MAVADATILLGLTFLINYMLLYKSHQFWCGIITIVIGTATYLIQPTNNPYGLIIIAVGVITIFTAPWDT